MHSRSLRHPVGEQGRATRDAEAEEMRKKQADDEQERAAERSFRCEQELNHKYVWKQAQYIHCVMGLFKLTESHKGLKPQSEAR
jgi:hypothetical protein